MPSSSPAVVATKADDPLEPVGTLEQAEAGDALVYPS